MSDQTESAVSDASTSEALAWLNRLLSGAVTSEDASAFQLWRGQSPAHEAAFTDAVRLQRMVRQAVRVRDANTARQNAFPQKTFPPARARRVRAGVDSRRRAFLLGGGAAAAAAASYTIAVRSDLLTDGLMGLTSDYRTGVGERRTAAVSAGVALELNTRTSIALLRSNGRRGVELKAGEAMISADRPEGAFVVAAASGRTILSRGQVNVRNQGGDVCVTCLAGEAEVERAGRRALLTAGHQVRYGGHGLGAVEVVDTLVTSAWRKGLLIFRDTPLQSVVDELNRYHPGKIFLIGESLARRPVYGVFRTNQIQSAIDQIRDLTGARIIDLPGGAVLLR